MKNTFVLIFLMLAITGYSQGGNDITLNIYSGDCRLEAPHALYLQDTIWIYRQQTLVQKIIPAPYTGVRNPIIVNHLTPGDYRLIFTNTYSQRVDKAVTIPDTSMFDVRICPDELSEYPVNSLSLLNKNESLQLIFKSTSCMVDADERVTIVRKAGYFVATLKCQDYKRSVTLSNQQVAEFTRFENELRHIPAGGGSTTQDYYTLRSKTGIYRKRDGNSNWEGYYFLKHSLFREKS
jgi:hypothetical protein